MVELVVSQCAQIPYDTLPSQVHIIASIHSLNRRFSKEQSDSIRSCLSPQLQRLFDIANEKGVSSWLTALPISDHGFNLHKELFGTPCAYAMAGNLHNCLLYVLVLLLF